MPHASPRKAARPMGQSPAPASTVSQLQLPPLARTSEGSNAIPRRFLSRATVRKAPEQGQSPYTDSTRSNRPDPLPFRLHRAAAAGRRAIRPLSALLLAFRSALTMRRVPLPAGRQVSPTFYGNPPSIAADIPIADTAVSRFSAVAASAMRISSNVHVARSGLGLIKHNAFSLYGNIFSGKRVKSPYNTHYI